jgi:hypothetical protein
MYQKDWTPEQIGKLTVNDLVILTRKRAPVDPAGGGTGELRSVDEVLALQARLAAQRAGEAEAWKGNGNA